MGTFSRVFDLDGEDMNDDDAESRSRLVYLSVYDKLECYTSFIFLCSVKSF